MTDLTDIATQTSAAGDQAGDALPPIIVSLLKGPIHRDRKAELWTALNQLKARVRDYVAVLGLDLVIDQAEGYAYLTSTKPAEDKESNIPRLMARRPLTFQASLLLALLRKRLAEFDSSGGGETRLIITVDEIAELFRLFLPDSTNEAKLLDQIERHITKVVELGFLRRLDKRSTTDKPARYEVQRILKAYVDGQWLAEFDDRLAEYRQRLEGADG